jgi:hypothetical protein
VSKFHPFVKFNWKWLSQACCLYRAQHSELLWRYITICPFQFRPWLQPIPFCNSHGAYIATIYSLITKTRFETRDLPRYHADWDLQLYSARTHKLVHSKKKKIDRHRPSSPLTRDYNKAHVLFSLFTFP